MLDQGTCFDKKCVSESRSLEQRARESIIAEVSRRKELIPPRPVRKALRCAF